MARSWIFAPINPNGRPNSDVVSPWLNGNDIVGRPSETWIIDFGCGMNDSEAAFYQPPFEYAREHVLPLRAVLRRRSHRIYWWRHAEPRPGMRAALSDKQRFIVTPRVAKHRLFAWADAAAISDTRLVVIARDDDAFFGLVQNRFYEGWALATCSWHGVGNDPTYNAESVFLTFPFPVGPDPEHSRRQLRRRPARHSHRRSRQEARRLAPRLAQSARSRRHRA